MILDVEYYGLIFEVGYSYSPGDVSIEWVFFCGSDFTDFFDTVCVDRVWTDLEQKILEFHEDD